MRYILALFLPWLSLMLQITLIGWIPTTIWAFTALNRMYADRRTDKIVSAMKNK